MRELKRRNLILALFFLSSACTMLRGGRDRSDDRVTQVTEWNERFQKILDTDPYVEGWALLSESPMENRGQIVVMRLADKEEADLFFAPSTETEAFTEINRLNRDKWGRFQEDIRKDDLEHFVKDFDGIRYSYLHYTKDSGELKKQREVRFSNPSAYAEATEYQKLMESFHRLVRGE